MRGARLAVLLAVATSAVGSAIPGQALAGDAPAAVLPGLTSSVASADLDGDGVRDVVRIVDANDEPGPAIDLQLEVWRHDGGSWRFVVGWPLPRWSTQLRDFVRVDPVTDAYGLLTWREAGVARVLLVAGIGPANRDGSPLSVCCVHLLWVRLEGTTLRFDLAHELGDAERITLLDMDADGTDELIAEGPAGPEITRRADTQQRQVTVLRWDGGTFSAQNAEIGAGGGFAPHVAVGEADGELGDEAIIGPMLGGRVVRVGLGADGALHVDSTSWGDPTSAFGWILGAVDGHVVVQGPDAIEAWRWPRGGDRELAARARTSPGRHAAVVGDGEHGVVVETAFDYETVHRGRTRVFALPDLVPSDSADPSPAAVELMTVAHGLAGGTRILPYGLYAHIGPVPPADGQVAAYTSMGNLVTIDGGGRVEVSATGTVASSRILDRTGPDDDWFILAGGIFGSDPRTLLMFLQGAFEAGPLVLATSDAVLEPEHPGAVVIEAEELAIGTWDGEERPFVREDGLLVTVTAPAGSTIGGDVERGSTYHEALGAETTRLILRPPSNRTEDGEYAAAVVAVTPDGHWYSEMWDLVVLREPPLLDASAVTRTGALAATVSGAASAHAAVYVDGRHVATDDSGRFETAVAAPLWPSDVTVVARDPLGNEARTVLSVVGGFDYRGLPWVAIVAVVTAVAGIVMYLRVPPRSEPAAVAGVDMEELDVDAT